MPQHAAIKIAVLGGHHAAVVEQVVGGLPAGSALALIVACDHTDDLAVRLRAVSALPVIDVTGTTELEHGRIYVVPPHVDAAIHDGALVLRDLVEPRSSLDRLLRSVADSIGRDAAAAILSGRGSDGALGIKQLKEAGGLTIAQASDGRDDDDDMPRAAIATGFVDLVLAPPEISNRLYALGLERPEPLAAVEPGEREMSGTTSDTLSDILTMVRLRSGHDFAAYKRATLYRRVARRMQVCHAPTIEHYQVFLRDHPAELANLLRDFLISVTHFFRDPEAFEALERLVIPRLFTGKTRDDQVRVWSVGCATGEEAYSIGMLLTEHAARLRDPPQLQMFATDIDEDALFEARAGRYPEAIAVDVPAARLERFFLRDGEHYRVTKDLRAMMLFSPHNALRDPPFSRLDLVSCRNLLIYLNRDAQDRVLNVFHFGLRPDGFLFLGSSEAAENAVMQFAPLDAKHRLFSRKMMASSIGLDAMVPIGRSQSSSLMPRPTLDPAVERRASFGELHHRIVERYAAPSVLVDDELDIVHVSEHAGQFLEISGGEPTRQVLRLVHPALRLDLRTAIHTARQPGHGIERRTVRFDDGGRHRAVDLRVRAMTVAETGRGALLITFDELDAARGGDEPRSESPADRAIEPVVRELEDELLHTREQLRSTIEQYETSLEELKASNEELHAINEELRSASEELETSKEELQSVNEELTTLNQELKVKVDEVGWVNSDLQNLMMSTDIGVVFLDRALNIMRFTPRARDLFNIIPTDIGRPLDHLTHRLDTTALPELARSVLGSLRTVEREVTADDGRRYLARLLPYRSIHDRIDGVVLTFVDVADLRDALDARRRSEAALQATEERLQVALRSASLIVLGLDEALQLTWAYAPGRQLDVAHTSVADVFGDHAERFLEITREVLATRSGRRIELELPDVQRVYDVRVEPSGTGVTAVGYDITPSKHAEAMLRDADRRKDEFLATLSHELRNPLTPLKVALDVLELAGDDPVQIRHSREIIARQVGLLGQLVDELLDLSRITQGKIEIGRALLDPVQVVEAALETIGPLIHDRGHALDVTLPPEPVHVVGDATRLIQVVSNLLSNAAKYTPDRGHIALALAPDRSRGVLVLKVRDDGIGIRPDMLSRIFEIFVQCRDPDGRSHGGLGIGLNLVHRLVELHGGTVRAASAGEGHGSEFTVELPLADS